MIERIYNLKRLVSSTSAAIILLSGLMTLGFNGVAQAAGAPANNPARSLTAQARPEYGVRK